MIERAIAHPIVRRIAMLAGGTGAAQLIAIATTPLLTRLYTPEAFGLLGVFGSLASIAVLAVSLRYELAIPLPVEERRARAVLALCLTLVVATSLAAVGLVALAGGSVARRLAAPDLEPLLWLLPVAMLFMGTYQAATYYAVRRQTFGVLATTRVAQSVVQVAVQIAGGLTGAGALGLVGGQVAGNGIGGGTLLRRLGGLTAPLPTLREVREVATAYRRFPLVSTGSSLLNGLGLYLPPILLAALYGPVVAGWFTLADRIVRLPLTLLGQAIGQVYLGRAAELVREDPAALQVLHRTATRNLFAIGVPVVLALVLAGPPLFELVFGGPWREAGGFVRALGVLLLFRLVAAPLSQTLNVIQRLDLQLAWDAVRLAVVLGVFAAADALAWSPTVTVTGYGIAMAALYASLIGLTGTALRGFVERSR